MKKIIYLLLFFIYIITRIMFLDSDLPTYDLTLYGSKDEQVYNQASINLLHFGEQRPLITSNIRADDSFPENGYGIRFLFQNYISYGFLKILGNNYFGLRGGPVFLSLLILFITLYLFKRNSSNLNESLKILNTTNNNSDYF